jgi:hypothetical protein
MILMASKCHQFRNLLCLFLTSCGFVSHQGINVLLTEENPLHTICTINYNLTKGQIWLNKCRRMKWSSNWIYRK